MMTSVPHMSSGAALDPAVLLAKSRLEVLDRRQRTLWSGIAVLFVTCTLVYAGLCIGAEQAVRAEADALRLTITKAVPKDLLLQKALVANIKCAQEAEGKLTHTPPYFMIHSGDISQRLVLAALTCASQESPEQVEQLRGAIFMGRVQ